ncbi:MAG: hypothetical protein Q4A46_04270 [Clostridia bacterium]|nr:hypothetical protein [Clostridia bacterium]
MAILNTLKGTLTTAVDSISDVAQTFVEKNRTKAKLNRLRLVMKNESEMMNRAYIALGKQFYEMQKKGEVKPARNQDQLFSVIEKSKAKIAKARICYENIIDSQNDYIYRKISTEVPEYNAENVVDITVACSNESDYKSSPFEKEEDKEAKPAEAKPEAEGESPDKELF